MIMLPPDDDPIDLDTLNRLLAEDTRRRNQKPDPEMGGLSPDQVTRLIYGDWLSGDHAVQIATGLTPAEYENAPLFRSIRKVLCRLRDQDGVKATSGGNFSRSFVREMLPFMYDESEAEGILKYYKAPNEDNVWRLHIARILCQLAGLIKKQKGIFRIPKNQQSLLADERAGELFATLFATQFQKFNLGYSRPLFDQVPAFQPCIAYALYRLGKVAADWVTPGAIAKEVLLPSVQEEMDAVTRHHVYWNSDHLSRALLVPPLVDWGMLEETYEETPRGIKLGRDIRITPLYHRLLHFHI